MKLFFSTLILISSNSLLAAPICLEHQGQEHKANLLKQVISDRYQLPLSLIQINEAKTNCILTIKIRDDDELEIIKVKERAMNRMIASFKGQ